MTGALLSTLPGDIPGLLRRGSPVLVLVGYLDETERHATVHAVGADGAVDLTHAWNRGRGGVVHYDLTVAVQLNPERVALDLSDPTGRWHAALWVMARTTTVICPTDPDSDDAAVTLATFGNDMTPDEIDILARLALRLAGRTP